MAADAQNTVQLVPAEIVDNSEAGANEADATAATAERRLTPAIRHVLERQLIAGQALSGELVIAATDVTAAVVEEAPAKVVAAVRDGAPLPAAFGQTGDALQDDRRRRGQPSAQRCGPLRRRPGDVAERRTHRVAEVAGSLVRAQGAVTGAAIGSALTVAAVATRAGDVRDTLDQEWRELAADSRSPAEMSRTPSPMPARAPACLAKQALAN